MTSEILDLSSPISWSLGPEIPDSTLPSLYFGSASVRLLEEDTFALFGGFVWNGRRASSSVLKFDKKDWKWEGFQGLMLGGRYHHTVVQVPADFNC